MIRVLLIVLSSPLLSLLSPATGQINWMSWEEAQAKNSKEPRKFIVDVYTQWCGWCKKMDKETFANPEIAKYVNKYYYAVKFDAETKTPITINDKVYEYVKSGNSGYHQLAAEIMFGKMSYPTIVFLDEKLNVLQPIPGYKDTISLERIMKYFAEDYYKTTPWKKYLEMYDKPAPGTMPVKSGS